MIYKTKSINEVQLIELKQLLLTASPPIGSHLEKVKSVPSIGNNVATRYDNTLLRLEPLGINNNPDLLKWLENFTGIESKFISNIHLNHMMEGAYFLPHIDNYHFDVEQTYTFLLEQPEEGGEFIIDSKVVDVRLDKVLIFNGGKVHHGVNKVKKGTRRSFIVFYNTPEVEHNLPII